MVIRHTGTGLSADKPRTKGRQTSSLHPDSAGYDVAQRPNEGSDPQMATVETATRTAKLTVALPVEAIDTVEKLAKESKKTKTQLLREAIALKAFIEQERAQPGTRILIERDGATRELVFT
jgi:hypothetical protein